jgi:putative transposase
MEKLELLKPGKTYRIVEYANGDEILFFEYANKLHFQKLIQRHLAPVCDIMAVDLKPTKVLLIVNFFDETRLPDKYRKKLYLPLSNLLNAYTKAINKRYNRKGSLFRKRFERQEISI